MSQPAQPAPTPGEWRKVLLPLAGGAFLVVLNETILSVAVRYVARQLARDRVVLRAGPRWRT
ncbi:hypothetical protein GCM10010365_75350 [Streptomyces poonensis]|uniref:Uncharacterized protein n=1 Tax=Streptomyces poonensis TaxID=68255 RepID=A0A918QE65_9ACTN|nr:hypothetical protein GCM10010365_75350 [Streptomyces poonensis]GLJ91680.1 hypothetical protein GCM10017589_42870 [Streptomyces poonensis]